MRSVKILACLLSALLLFGCAQKPQVVPAGDFTSVPPATASSSVPADAPVAAETSLVYRAMWVSYLEWSNFNTENADTFTQSVAALYDNCVSLGLNCVIVQVRPFSDAIYPSTLYPWSHIITGTQGQDPGYDPLAILVQEAHKRGLLFEAWINPYRVRLTQELPRGELAAQNPALLHPEWTAKVEDGIYFDPACAEAQDMIVQGVLEIVRSYEVDGIQFDDYFYPTTDPTFDAQRYAQQGSGQELAAWRRGNVDALVQAVYKAIKAEKPSVVFGISPQGNNGNNYNGQYSDVALWLSQPGYVDYIMPQVYWGYGYTQKSGSTEFAFENITKWWAALPRHADVSLAFGLGAYRIGEGDGGTNDQSQWESGHNLADMAATLAAETGVRGFAIYRYDSLFHNEKWDALCTQEQAALRSALQK